MADHPNALLVCELFAATPDLPARASRRRPVAGVREFIRDPEHVEEFWG